MSSTANDHGFLDLSSGQYGVFYQGHKVGQGIGYSYTTMAEVTLTNDVREAHKKVYCDKLKELLEEVK
jgi:hypothetical protein